MKKIKILALFLALATCFSLVSCKRREGEASSGLEMMLSENGTYYIVTGIGSCKDYDVLLPLEHKGLPVAAIGERAFKGTEITRITLTENVRFIAENAFEGCAKMAYNELEGLYYLGTEKNPTYALVSASEDSETTFLIHKNTKILADCALYDCDITYLSLPEGVTHIGKNALYGCFYLERVDIPAAVSYIGAEAFGNCGTLTEINLPKSVSYIGDSAFMYCSKLAKINFAGTEAEWNAMEKAPRWDRDMKEYKISFAG
jgi:hypothetical protein